MLDSSQLVHIAVLERYQGDGAAGVVFGAPVQVACYAESVNALLEKPTNTEVGVEGKLWCNLIDMPVGSRVTLQGRTTYVRAAATLDDGSGLSHLEVALSAAPRAAVTRVAAVSLAKPPSVASEWSDAAEATVPVPDAVYASNVAARITSQIRRATRDTHDSAEETLSIPPYLVSVDHDLNAYEGDHVLVTACPEDPSLVGRTLQVEQVVRGTGRLERDLFCSLVDINRP